MKLTKRRGVFGKFSNYFASFRGIPVRKFLHHVFGVSFLTSTAFDLFRVSFVFCSVGLLFKFSEFFAGNLDFPEIS